VWVSIIVVRAARCLSRSRARPVGTAIPAGARRAVIPEKRAGSGDPTARNYTGDSSPGHRAATGDGADAARPRCSAAPTALRRDGSAPGGDGEQGGISRVARLAMKVIRLIKASKIKELLSTTAD
jgi:hypothetical protein